jgi:ATP-dependent Lhr-like helicase
VRGELRPGGNEREWCDPDVLRRLRRASLATLRHEVEAAEQKTLARFLPTWQGVDAAAPGGAGVDRLREMLIPLQGVALTPEVWERDVLPRRLGAYSPAWLDALCAGGEVVWVGAGALGRSSGRVALYFREDLRLLGPPPGTIKAEAPGGAVHDALRERLARGACFFTDLLAAVIEADGRAIEPVELQEALWDLAWAGEATNDAFAPLRAGRLSLANTRAQPRRRFASRRRGPAAPQTQGRWSLVAPLIADSPGHGLRTRALAELLLERHGVLTREAVLAEGIPGGFSSLYGELTNLETLGTARRGYFVEGLGGAQFALGAAVERLRGLRSDEPAGALVLAATDPANPYGATLPWPKREEGDPDPPGHSSGAAAPSGLVRSNGAPPTGSGSRSPGGGRRPSRVPGAYVVTLDAEPALYVEKGGKGLVAMREPLDGDGAPAPWIADALEALAEAVGRGRLGRMALERFDGEPVVGSGFEAALIEAGFRQGPRKLTLSA